MAMASVFPDPYEFRVRFIQRRNRTECDLFFVKNEEECDPLTAAGGGAVDVAGFALRVAVWSLKKTRNVFILDEPFRFLSVNLQAKCSAMMKEISDKLKVQVILVSHLPNIIESADKVFKIENVKGESKVSIM
jgi:DNA repair exonuclease SbcCD ATPase subunit